MTPLRLAFVSYNSCVRMRQTALAAMLAGHEAHLLVHRDAALREFNDRFSSLSVFNSPHQLTEGLKNIRPDIILAHDRPHQIVATALDCAKEAGGIPVIHDVHDMFSLMAPGQHNDADEPHEARTLREAAGLVFVSESNRQYAEKKYGPLPPNVVSKSAVLSQFFPSFKMLRVGGAVWGGGLYVESPSSPRFYIDQREIIRRFAGIGQSATIYHAPLDVPGSDAEYAQAGAILGGMESYLPMLAKYSRYDFGWYGQTTDHPQIHGTIPNKLFEYTAAGIPTLVINASEAGKYVEEQGIGVHIKRPEDLIYVRDRLEALRPKVWARRWAITREKETQCLWELSERLAKKPSTGVSAVFSTRTS